MNFFIKKAHRSRAFFAACLALSLGACDSNNADVEEPVAATSTISGNVAYRERILLTPGHTLKVTLTDASIADIDAPVLGETSRVLKDEQVPLAFELQVESSKLLPPNQYHVRAVLLDPDGDLSWTTDTAIPIDAALQVQDLGMLQLVKVDPSADLKPKDDRTLAGTAWRIEDAVSGGIIDSANLTMNFDENGRLGGFSGCNQYSGEFSVNGSELKIGTVAATMMACPAELMDLEQMFLSVLGNAIKFSIHPETDKLMITAADGQTLIAIRSQ